MKKHDFNIDFDFQDESDFYDEISEIDLSSEKVSWKEFCDIIAFYNEEQQYEDTKNYENFIISLKSNYKNNFYYTLNYKLTVMGLDDIPLPGTPNTCKLKEEHYY